MRLQRMSSFFRLALLFAAFLVAEMAPDRVSISPSMTRMGVFENKQRALTLRGGGMTKEAQQAWEETVKYRTSLDEAAKEHDEDLRDATQKVMDEIDAVVEKREAKRKEEIEKHGSKYLPIINQHFMDPENYTQDFGPGFHPAYPLTPTEAMMDPSCQLRESACRGRIDELRQLAAAGADVNKPDDNGLYAAAHWAALMGRTETLQALLELGANISATTRYWRTPLHYAAEEGHDACVSLLLAAGAPPTPKDRDGATPGDLAALAGKNATALLLEECVAGARSEE